MKNHFEKPLIVSMVALVLLVALGLSSGTASARTFPVPDDSAYVRVLNYVPASGILVTEQGRFRVTEETRIRSLSGASETPTLMAGSSVAIVETVDEDQSGVTVVLSLWVDDRR